MIRDHQEGESIAKLSRIYGVSRQTIYKWLERYEQFGAAGLVDRSRRPLHTGRRASAAGKTPKA
jgi:transposase